MAHQKLLGIYSAGSILRFPSSQFISPFSYFLGLDGTKNSAKSIACLIGILLALDLGFFNLCIQTD